MIRYKHFLVSFLLASLMMVLFVYREDAERLATKLRKLRLIDLLENVEVGEVPFAVQNGQPSKIFKVRLKVYPSHRYPPHLNLTLEEIEKVLREQFIPRLMKDIKKSFQSRSGKSKENIIQVAPTQTGEGAGAETFDNGSCSCYVFILLFQWILCFLHLAIYLYYHKSPLLPQFIYSCSSAQWCL